MKTILTPCLSTKLLEALCWRDARWRYRLEHRRSGTKAGAVWRLLRRQRNLAWLAIW